MKRNCYLNTFLSDDIDHIVFHPQDSSFLHITAVPRSHGCALTHDVDGLSRHLPIHCMLHPTIRSMGKGATHPRVPSYSIYMPAKFLHDHEFTVSIIDVWLLAGSYVPRGAGSDTNLALRMKAFMPILSRHVFSRHILSRQTRENGGKVGRIMVPGNIVPE